MPKTERDMALPFSYLNVYLRPTCCDTSVFYYVFISELGGNTIKFTFSFRKYTIDKHVEMDKM